MTKRKIAKRTSLHIGGDFEDFLREEGRLVEATMLALRRILAWKRRRVTTKDEGPLAEEQHAKIASVVRKKHGHARVIESLFDAPRRRRVRTAKHSTGPRLRRRP